MAVIIRKIVSPLLGLCLLTLTQLGYAQYSGYYIGLFGGNVDLNFEFEVPVLIPGPDPNTFDDDIITLYSSPYDLDGELGGLLIGYRFNDNVQTEVSYIDFGDFESVLEFTSPGFSPLDLRGSLSASGLTASIVGNYPVTQRWHVFAKLGLAYSDLDTELVDDSDGSSFDVSEDSSGLFFGVGMLFSITRSIALTVDYQKYNISSNVWGESVDIEALSAGMRFNY